MVNAINIALTGLQAASRKLEAAASNIVNYTTSGSLEDGKKPPYTPLTTAQETLPGPDGKGAGVEARLALSERPFIPHYDPDSFFANEKGLIGLPAVNLAEEAINLQIAKHSYKASAAVFRAAAEMEKDMQKLFDKDV